MAKETKKPDPLAQPPQPIDWSQHGNAGFENVQQTDLGIPFLMICQKLSPEYDKTNPAYATKKIADIDIGDIFDSLKREIVGGPSEPVRFVPCTYERLAMEWKPRNSGGGFVKAHKTMDILDECTRNDKNQDVLRNGNLVIPTAYFYGIRLGENNERIPCVIGMAATQLKAAKLWLNSMMSIKFDGPHGKYTPPPFSHEYRITTTLQSNASGNWMGWVIDRGEMLKDPVLIAEAVNFAKSATNTVRPALQNAPADDSHIS